jgi:hypothetical protein
MHGPDVARRVILILALAVGAALLPSKVTAQQTPVKLFLIAVGDEGKSGPRVGCGDSLVAVTREAPSTGDRLAAVVSLLLSLEGTQYGRSGLYNALGQSALKLDRAVLIDGVARIELSGRLVLAGTCDAPRVEAQLRETVLQVDSVKSVSVTLNGQPLAEALSGR